MKIYQEFAKNLTQLLGGATAVRITVPGYLPLSVEEIGRSEDGRRLVSLCHYGEQNGDLMRDPDIVFLLHDLPDGTLAEPISFRNDYLGIEQEVYRYSADGIRTHVAPTLKRDLKDFAQTWFTNLHQQGFFQLAARRRGAYLEHRIAPEAIS
jgi:hypothetical protein